MFFSRVDQTNVLQDNLDKDLQKIIIFEQHWVFNYWYKKLLYF